jgi:hypothetical protein
MTAAYTRFTIAVVVCLASCAPKEPIPPVKEGVMKRMHDEHISLLPEWSYEHEISKEAVQKDIVRLSQRLQARANSIQKRCRTNDRAYWKTRGQQRILRAVAGHLREICAQPSTAYVLFLVLKDYLGCLEKYAVDAEEEKRAARPGNDLSMQQWKSEGEAEVLPAIKQAITSIVETYRPLQVHHVLALDGERLVSLRRRQRSKSDHAV